MRSSRRDWNQRRRAVLYGEQDGLCFWCEEPMVLLLRYPTDGRIAGNVCTLDHLRDRDNPKRQEPVRGDQRLVAACCACNHQRDRSRQIVNSREARA